MRMRGKLRLAWIVLACATTLALGVPVVPCTNCRHEAAVKRDIFMSRGWGAGGMPFTLYYPNRVNVEARDQPSVDYLKSSSYQEQQEPSNEAVLPQLFVSYGWGPLGK